MCPGDAPNVNLTFKFIARGATICNTKFIRPRGLIGHKGLLLALFLGARFESCEVIERARV